MLSTLGDSTHAGVSARLCERGMLTDRRSRLIKLYREEVGICDRAGHRFGLELGAESDDDAMYTCTIAGGFDL
jgi:hypothetical protein